MGRAPEQSTLSSKPTHIRPAATAQAKLDLANVVLSGQDFVECAHTALRWLGNNAGVQRAICAVVDDEARFLVGLAGDGVPSAQVNGFSISLGSADDPLLIALAGSEPISFDDTESRARPSSTPLGDAPFHAIPLRRPETAEKLALGLLLVSGIEGPVDMEVQWVASLLGTRLACLRQTGAETRRHRNERERELLERVINAVTQPILLSDSDGRILIANDQAEQLFTASESVSEGRRRAIALNNMLFSAALSSASGWSEPSRRELPLVDPSEGVDLLFELLSTTIKGADGEAAVVSVLHNVNDLRSATLEIEEQYRRLRLAETATREERDRLDLIINALGDPILVTDPAGKIVLMNPPAERLFEAAPRLDGGDEAHALDRHVRANDAMFFSFVSNLYTTETLRWRGELTLVDPATGSKLPFEAIAGRAIGKEGEDTAVVTILHDRKEALEKAHLLERVKLHSEDLQRKIQEATVELTQQNERLREQAADLEQASEAKSRFVASISHELRTPLNAVLGYTDLLRKGVFGNLTAQQDEKLGRIDSNARHLLSIINDLLDIARIEAGHVRLDVGWFDVSDLVDEVMSEMESIITRSRLSVTSVFGDDLPQANSDRQKVKQILLNLLSNAVKFTPEGFIHVRATYAKVDDQFMISVADTGIGIPENELRTIFDDFRQGDQTAARQSGGTGLGLGICRRLAKILGGRLTLVSNPGSGSTFTLHFPRDRKDHEAEE